MSNLAKSMQLNDVIHSYWEKLSARHVPYLRSVFTFPPAVSHARLLNCTKSGWPEFNFTADRFAILNVKRFENCNQPSRVAWNKCFFLVLLGSSVWKNCVFTKQVEQSKVHIQSSLTGVALGVLFFSLFNKRQDTSSAPGVVWTREQFT